MRVGQGACRPIERKAWTDTTVRVGRRLRRLATRVAWVASAAVTSWLGARDAAAQQTRQASVDDLDLVKLLNVQVSTASKTAESVDDAPAVITVVTRDDIHRWGYQTVAEVLNHCVGFYVLDNGIVPDVGVRGMTGGLDSESSVIKVMIDGRSVAYRTTSGNWLGVELVPLESIKQIEIIRGPASALYGADAFLGVVNIITEPPDRTRPLRARIFTGLTGSNATELLDVASGGTTGRFDYSIGVGGEYGSRNGLVLPSDSPGPTLPDYVGTRRTAENLDRRSLVVQTRLGYRVPNVGQLVLSATVSGFERGGDFAPLAQLTNQVGPTGQQMGTVVSEGQTRVNLEGLSNVAPALDLEVQSTYFLGGVLPDDRVEVGSELFYVRRRQSNQGVDSVLEGRWHPHPRFNLVAGVEGVFDHEALLAPERIDRATGEAVLTGGAVDHRVDLTNVGAYVSSNVTAIERWLRLTGGLRFDSHSIYGNQLTGRVGATSHLTSTLVAKLLYGSAFKAPSPYLLYASPVTPGDVVGNPNLKPQTIDTAEAQLSWRPNPVLSATTGVSYNWLFNEAEFTPQGINQTARNIARQRTVSWETTVNVKYYDDIDAYVSSELNWATRELGEEGYAAQLVGTHNVIYPPFVFRGGVLVGLPSPPTFPLSVGAEAMYVGPRRADDTSQIDAGRSFDLPPYVLMSATLTTRSLYIIPGHESVVALHVRNVLNTVGPDPGYGGIEVPLTQREIFLELRHTY
jgi:outer membrane receptor for ferrienterochelin and colicins